MASENERLQNLITWDFTLISPFGGARYGRLAGEFYKQFLPGLNVFADLHPPRKIPRFNYELAQKQRSAPGS